MATISSLIPDVQVRIPEIPDFVAVREYIRAARDFCEETRAWREDISIDTTASTATVDISSLLSTGAELVDVISIKNSSGGAPLVPRTFAWLDENTSDWRNTEATDATWYMLEDNNVLRFVYTPDATVVGKYYARVAVKPTVATSTTISDVLANKYDEVLVHGTLSRLFSLPRKPWTDANLAEYHRGLFERAIPGARTAAAEEHQTGQPRKVKYGGL